MIRSLVTALTLAAAAPAAAQTACADRLAAGTDLWHEPQDTVAALTETDCYAWQLFIALNWPAVVAAKAPDTSLPFGGGAGGGKVVWETWRNVRVNAPDTVFFSPPRDPGPWLDGTTPEVRLTAHLDPEPQQVRMLRGPLAPEVDPETAGTMANETRMNRQAYDFVRDKGLFSKAGQQALFDSGVETIDFPLEAKEIKAQWRRIEEADKPRYHWTTITDPAGAEVLVGLTALHITTKDVPNWVWATFEHLDNELPHDGGIPPQVGWQTVSVDRYACPVAPHDCNKAPAVVRGTKWENYVLRGTQLDFTDGRGNPTILANSQPEAFFQATSSCITCHALSGIGASGERLPIFRDLPDGSRGGFVGVPDPRWFRDPAGPDGTPGALRYTQFDFVWALERAQ